MVISFLILVFSSALFFFYLQALSERILRREFSHPYCQNIIGAIQLEYPRLREAVASNTPLEYSEARLALECDFMTLKCLLKNSSQTHRHLSRHEKILLLYFRFLLSSLPICYSLNLQKREAVLKMAAILQFFANLVGERITVSPVGSVIPNPQS